MQSEADEARFDDTSLTVHDAVVHSVNLPFIRLMRDIVDHVTATELPWAASAPSQPVALSCLATRCTSRKASESAVKVICCAASASVQPSSRNSRKHIGEGP